MKYFKHGKSISLGIRWMLNLAQLCKLISLLGYLSREVKEATGMGHLDNVLNDAGFRETVAMRWCMMISSRPIVSGID